MRHVRPHLAHVGPDMRHIRLHLAHVGSYLPHVRSHMRHVKPHMRYVGPDMRHVRPHLLHVGLDMRYIQLNARHVSCRCELCKRPTVLPRSKITTSLVGLNLSLSVNRRWLRGKIKKMFFLQGVQIFVLPFLSTPAIVGHDFREESNVESSFQAVDSCEYLLYRTASEDKFPSLRGHSLG
jgi:hypothetical protein